MERLMVRWAAGVCAMVFVCAAASQPAQYFDVTAQSGIDFVHHNGASGRYYLVETVTAGMGVLDYDNDGDLDLYFVNGASLPGSSYENPPRNALFRNDGGLHFTRVSDEAGASDAGYGLGCAMGDYNNDGFVDIYVANMGDDVLLKNNGDGTFSDVTKAAGLGDPRIGAGCAFADFNNDGWLDIFVANYVICPLDQPKECTRLGVRLYCDPSTFEDLYPPQPASLYFNNGDGTFRDASVSSGIAAMEGRGMAVCCTDFDNDGDVDIFVANDVSENFLWQNNGDETFDEVGAFSGVAYDEHGREQGSMGCDFGDYDCDGAFDLIVTSYQRQTNTLYHNLGGGSFEDVTIREGLLPGSMENVSWACFFFDYDNDADQDILIANGHLQPNIQQLEPAITYPASNQIFQNRNGVFVDVSTQTGPGLAVKKSTRGGVYGDLDGDGDLDLAFSNSEDGATLLENRLQDGNGWINIRPQGVDSNRDGIGARISVIAGGKTQVIEVRAGGSYQSCYSAWPHFGLGEAKRIDAIEIDWPSGRKDHYEDVAINQTVILKEGGEIIKP